jgi:hypothetical protein
MRGVAAAGLVIDGFDDPAVMAGVGIASFSGGLVTTANLAGVFGFVMVFEAVVGTEVFE